MITVVSIGVFLSHFVLHFHTMEYNRWLKAFYFWSHRQSKKFQWWFNATFLRAVLSFPHSLWTKKYFLQRNIRRIIWQVTKSSSIGVKILFLFEKFSKSFIFFENFTFSLFKFYLIFIKNWSQTLSTNHDRYLICETT